MEKEVKIYTLEDLPTSIQSEPNKHIIYYFYHGYGDLDKDEVKIDVKHEDSIVSLKGCIVGTGKDSIKFNTYTNHSSGNNNARVHIKNVMMDQSRFDFEGLIRIEKDAQQSDSFLQQDNLLTNENVICNSSPQLEILADDVKASHGVTVGSFDGIQLYYLTSRGLSLEAAKNLIAEGFLADVYGDNVGKVKEYFSLNSFLDK